MYNWSVDEKFKNLYEVIEFLKQQPEVTSLKVSSRRDRGDTHTIIETKLESSIHPAKKFSLASLLSEKCEGLRISILEDK